MGEEERRQKEQQERKRKEAEEQQRKRKEKEEAEQRKLEEKKRKEAKEAEAAAARRRDPNYIPYPGESLTVDPLGSLKLKSFDVVYKVGDVINEGFFGVVYKGHHTLNKP